MKLIQQYVYNIFYVLDVLLSCIFWGSRKETCSSRLGRYYGKVWIATAIANAINWVALKVFGQANHCQINIQPAADHEGEILK